MNVLLVYITVHKSVYNWLVDLLVIVIMGMNCKVMEVLAKVHTAIVAICYSLSIYVL